MNSSASKRSFFDLFPAPDFLLLSVTGLALSDHAVRFIQVRRSFFGSRLKLSHNGKKTLPAGAIESGVIKNRAVVVDTLKKLASAYDLRFVRATLPDEKAYLFTATIDRVPAKDVRDAVSFIIEENAPVTLAESVFDYEIVDFSNPKKLSVTVTVVPKEIVESYTRTLEEAGITPVAFDVESQAIARAVLPAGKNPPTLIVNLGEAKTSFYIVQNGAVRFSTATLQGQDDSYEPTAETVKDEIEKIFTFWNTKIESKLGSEEKIEKVILCGIGALNKKMSAEILKESPVAHATVDPWVNAAGKNSASAVFTESLEYNVPIGLVLAR